MLAQVTESGMNNSTMAKEIHKQLQELSDTTILEVTPMTESQNSPSQLEALSGTETTRTASSVKPIAKWINSSTWDPKHMHHFCACHKLGLVVKHGLAALGINSRASTANKQFILGQFPVVDIMPVIEEEDE